MGQPDRLGYFGRFGGRFVPETLMAALEELQAEYASARRDPRFRAELTRLHKTYSGRPTPLYFAARLTETWGGAQVYLKREDLNHTGAHKINNALGQALLAGRMGKRRIIAETGAGQHGVAVATVSALFGMDCMVYMGEEDMRRQAPNVQRMKLLGANVAGVSSGTATLKDATNEAMRDWVTSVDNTHYIIGSTVGPHPFPMIVRDFQSIIGKETRQQVQKQSGRLPDVIIACVGGGSNAMGMFHAFLRDKRVALIGVESAGDGLRTLRHAATIGRGRPGVMHGSHSYMLQTPDGQVAETHTLSAGLDYPGVGPEHAFLHDSKRVSYRSCTDREALAAFLELTRLEGIIPALESSFALAQAKKTAATMSRHKILVVNVSGRGDKDLESVLAALERNRTPKQRQPDRRGRAVQ